MRQPLLILGGGGEARELLCWMPYERFEFNGFYAPDEPENDIMGYQVLRVLPSRMFVDFIVAAVDPLERMRLWDMALQAGAMPAMPVVHPSVMLGAKVTMGRGSVVYPNAVIGEKVDVGLNCIIQSHCSMAYDTTLEDHSYMSAGARLCGGAHVKEVSFLGVNSVVARNVSVGPRASVGNSIAIFKEVCEGVTVLGQSGRYIDPQR